MDKATTHFLIKPKLTITPSSTPEAMDVKNATCKLMTHAYIHRKQNGVSVRYPPFCTAHKSNTH